VYFCAFEWQALFVYRVDDDDISGGVTNNIVESYPTAGHLPRPKLLQFWENRRPPYWGTWRKKSQLVGPKNPFSRDEVSKYIFV
jgi:chromatin assembly factor 1 subunit A